MPLWLLIGLMGALSCSTRAAPPTTESPAPVMPPPKPAVEATPASATPALPAPAAIPIASAADGGSVVPAPASAARARTPTLSWSENIEPWLSAQGVPTSGLDSDALCRKAVREAEAIQFCSCGSIVTLGKPAEQALLCEYGMVRENHQLVRHALLLGVRAKQPRAIWSIPVAIGPLDPPEPRAEFRIRVRVELQPNGLALRASDMPGSSCKASGKFDVDYPERNAVRLREQAICKARGDYTWRAGTFRKTAPGGNGRSGP
jgi:hypothetical protein